MEYRSFFMLTVSSLLLSSVALAESPFVKVERIPATQTQAETQSNYQIPLLKALDLHNLMVSLPSFRQFQQTQADAKEQLDYQNKRFDDMTTCNIRRLGKYFQNPEDVWEKMTKTYDAQEKQLAVFLNSAQRYDPDQLPNVTPDDQTIIEQNATWTLGKNILTDVYANPEKWGTPKGGAGKSSVFPLWKDQKYLYDKEYNDFYAQINTYFGVSSDVLPQIGDQKYDYTQYDELIKAHADYLKKMSAQAPKKLMGMPASFKMPPVPPKPLPPADEIVKYIGDPEETRQVFPEWPEPWQKFMKSNFEDFNPTGEMAQDFIGKSLRLKESVRNQDASLQDNRLNVYQGIKKERSTAQKLVEITQAEENNLMSVLDSRLASHGLAMETPNLLDETQYNQVKKAIREQKEIYLKQAEEEMSKLPSSSSEDEQKTLSAESVLSISPQGQEDVLDQLTKDRSLYVKTADAIQSSRVYQARQLIEALKTDSDGHVTLSRQNAGQIDQLMKEAAATEALKKEIELFNKRINKTQRKKLDDMCLNGGTYIQ